jgi:hypothetical protein
VKNSMIVRWEEQAKVQRAAREAIIVADYRKRHSEVAPTTRDAIVLLLADMEAGLWQRQRPE